MFLRAEKRQQISNLTKIRNIALTGAALILTYPLIGCSNQYGSPNLSPSVEKPKDSKCSFTAKVIEQLSPPLTSKLKNSSFVVDQQIVKSMLEVGSENLVKKELAEGYSKQYTLTPDEASQLATSVINNAKTWSISPACGGNNQA